MRLRFGKALRRLRISRGLTQRELADLLGVHAAALSRWERGAHLPNVEDFREVCIALRASADKMLQLPRRTPPRTAAAPQPKPLPVDAA